MQSETFPNEEREMLKERYAVLARAYWADAFDRIDRAPESFKDSLDERDALIASGVPEEEANQNKTVIEKKQKRVSAIWGEMDEIEKRLDAAEITEILERIKGELKKD